jgi:Gram-negative porin
VRRRRTRCVISVPINALPQGHVMTDRSRFAARSLAVLVASAGLSWTLPVPSARAADLGGDCCNDLEERVAALDATTVRKGNKKVSLTISGRVHANIMAWQDSSSTTDPAEPFDHLSDVYFGNTAGSGNRFVLDGQGEISKDLSAGFQMVITSDFGGAHSQVEHQSGGALDTDGTYLFLHSERLGELRLGNMYSASDDAYYNDFGAPGVVGGLAGARFVGDFILRDTAAPGTLTDVTYGHVLYELEGDLENRLMYISPTFGGFTLKADVGGDDTASVGLGYSATQRTWNVALGAGYQVSRRGDGHSVDGGQAVQKADSTETEVLSTETARVLALSGSIYESGSGLFVTAEYSAAYADVAGRQDATNWYARAGWTKDVTGMGATTVDVQYERTDNLLASNTSAHLWGVGLDQALDAAASDIYVHYQHNSWDSTLGTIGPQAIDSLTSGMIVRF